MVATGVSTQFGSTGVASALEAGGVTAALDKSVVAELDSTGSAPALELSGCVTVSEEAGTVALDCGAAISLEDVGVVPPWFTFAKASVELSSPHAKSETDKMAPVKANEMRVFLCIA